MIEKGAMCPGSCLPLLYLDRNKGGRGLKNLEDCYNESRIKIGIYLTNIQDITIQEILKIEQGRKKESLIEKSKKIANKLGLEIEKNEKNNKYGIKIINNNKKNQQKII